MRRKVLILLGLSLLSAAVFAQTRQFNFINYDDPAYILERPGLRDGVSWSGMRWAVTATFGNYIPVTELSYLVDYSMHGLDAGGYHLTNTILHTANGLLLFLFLARTTGAAWPSAIVAALFLVHPLRVESVAWIAARKDLTCALFWMLTLHAYAWYVRSPGSGRYVVVFLGTSLALLAKPMAVTLPCVLLLMDVWPFRRVVPGTDREALRRTAARCVLEKLPLGLPVVISAFVTLAIQKEAGALSSIDRLPIGERVGNAVHSYFAYVVNTVVPRNLVPIYPFDRTEAALVLPLNLLILLVIGLVTTWAIRSVHRAPWFTVGWLWYLGTLVPVIGLIQVGAQSMADRYTYLPQIGLFIAAVWSVAAATRLNHARVSAAILAAALVAGYGFLAYRQTARWRDSLTLWTYTVGVMPENAVAQSLLGEALLESGQSSEARWRFENALRIQPLHRPALVNLAKIEAEDGRFDAALEHCEQLFALRADDPAAHTTAASILIRQGRLRAALEHVDIALEADPNHANALVNRAAILLLLGEPQAALESAARAVQLLPDDAAAFTNLATANYVLGNRAEAGRFCAEALRLDPDYAPALALQGDLNAAP